MRPQRPAPPPGRATIFAGLTVAISVTGLAFFGLDFVTKLGIGSALGVLTTVLIANSLLIAALAKLGGGTRRESVGGDIILFVITFGFYGWYWAYKNHTAMKQETGEGNRSESASSSGSCSTRSALSSSLPVVGRMYRQAGKDCARSRPDGPLALPVRLPDRARDCLVRGDPARAEPLLGGGRCGGACGRNRAKSRFTVLPPVDD